jgi:hypothetical protein
MESRDVLQRSLLLSYAMLCFALVTTDEKCVVRLTSDLNIDVIDGGDIRYELDGEK